MTEPHPTYRSSFAALAAIALATAAALPSSVRAQTADSVLVPGQRIRLVSGSTELAGTFVEIDQGFLFITPEEQPELTLNVPLIRLDRIEVWACCDMRESFLRGALYGAAAAVIGGAILQLLPGADPHRQIMRDALVIGVPSGVVAGSLIGGFIVRSRGWVAVEIPVGGP